MAALKKKIAMATTVARTMAFHQPSAFAGLVLPPRVRPRNVAKWNVAKRYFGAPLIYGNRRPDHFRPTFKLHCDKEIGAVDIFVVPDFAAPRTPAIEVDGVRVRCWMTGT
jgi:hypothetical protein